MKTNMVKWINQIYLIIDLSVHFWLGILTKGITHRLTEIYSNDFPDRPVIKTRFQQALSLVWLLLLVNIFLASSLYIEMNHPLINFLSYIILLVFIAITVFISWLSYIQATIDLSSETQGLLTAFHSAVRFWSTSLSFSLYLVLAILVGFSNLIILMCLLPGIYCQLSKLMMSRYQKSFKNTQLL